MVRLPEVTEVIRVRLSPADLAVVQQLKTERGIDTSRLVRELIRAAAGPREPVGVVQEEEVEPETPVVQQPASRGTDSTPPAPRTEPAPAAIPAPGKPPAATKEPRRSDYPNGQGGQLRFDAHHRRWAQAQPRPRDGWS